MYQLSKQPQPFWLVIKDGFHLWWASHSQWWPIATILVIIAYLPLFNEYGFNTFDLENLIQFDFRDFTILSAIYFIILFNFTIVSIRINNYAENIKDSLRGSLVQAVHRYPAAFIGLIIYCAIVAIGFILFLIPGYIMLILFALTLPLIVIRHMPPHKALVLSYEMVTNHWWHSFMILFTISVIYFVFMQIILYSTHHWSVCNVLSVIASIILLPLGYSNLIVLLHDLELNIKLQKSKKTKEYD